MPPPVRAQLSLVGAEPPLDARLTVHSTDVDRERVHVTIVLENDTKWQLTLEPHSAAYLAGLIAQESGVVFG